MIRSLPPNPTLKHLKHQAKDLLKGHREHDPGVCSILRLLGRFARSSDEEILDADLTLSEAQFALAMEYGFDSWSALREHVLRRFGGDAPEGDERPGAVLVENAPPGKGNSNRFARAVAMTLGHAGCPADYDTIMGDSGLAFILQADEYAISSDGDVDIGWWPLDPWGAMLRLDFVGTTVGRGLRTLPGSREEYRADPRSHYVTHFEKEITEAVRKGTLPLAFTDHWWVICGFDDGEPPLLGARAVFEGHERRRLPGYPWNVIVLGEPLTPRDRREADLSALAFAVSLGRDRFDQPSDGAIQRCPEQDNDSADGRSTGQRSFALWAQLLRDSERWGKHYYHANMVFHLRINRQSAGPYLRKMAGRHEETVASCLLAAAGVYEDVLRQVTKADTSEAALSGAQGRENLACLVEDIAGLEAEAVRYIESAIAAVK
jgi:hypothetical protein